MSNILKFKDPNFRLAVINVLMYEKNIIKPAIDPFDFAENYSKRDIDIEEEGYEIIPEIMEYFNELEILESQVKDIEEVHQDGGDDIYMTICPFWSGEDDIFNICSAEDSLLLPKLKKITLFGPDDNNKLLLDAFEEKGISADWL